MQERGPSGESSGNREAWYTRVVRCSCRSPRCKAGSGKKPAREGGGNPELQANNRNKNQYRRGGGRHGVYAYKKPVEINRGGGVVLNAVRACRVAGVPKPRSPL